MDNFQMFTIIFNMTGGGPVEATTTLSLAAYKKAFFIYDIGQGSAIGVLWMLLLIVATIFYNRMNSTYTANYM
jgi:multiple sugar transport system permease protein